MVLPDRIELYETQKNQRITRRFVTSLRVGICNEQWPVCAPYRTFGRPRLWMEADAAIA